VHNCHQFDCIVMSHWTRNPFCKMTNADDNIKWFHQHCSSTYNWLETGVPMVDIATFTIKHINKLCLSHVSKKVKSDLFKILLDYSKAKGNLVVFFIEPITSCLLNLIEDDEFNVDNFVTYHLSMPIVAPESPSPFDVSRLEKYRTNVLLTCLTKVRC
jgi:hypothetical protein